MIFARRGRRRRGRYWRDPERLEGQADRDAQLGRTAFYVYVLGTDYGHYVGHTWNVGNRIRQHQRGEVASTAGGDPRLLWRSEVFSTREDAAGFEAALKSWRDQGSPRFRETVGVSPELFDNPALRRARPTSSGCFSLALVSLLILLGVLVTLVGCVPASLSWPVSPV